MVFNAEVYQFLPYAVGLRPSRHVFKKRSYYRRSDYPRIQTELEKLCNICNEYAIKHRLADAPNYIRIFTNKGHDDVIADISAKMELLIEELSNSKRWSITGILK